MPTDIDALMQEVQDTNLAAEQLRMKFNALIATHRLSGAAALHLLARLSAGYIHQLQRVLDQQGADIVVEVMWLVRWRRWNERS